MNLAPSNDKVVGSILTAYILVVLVGFSSCVKIDERQDARDERELAKFDENGSILRYGNSSSNAAQLLCACKFKGNKQHACTAAAAPSVGHTAGSKYPV